MFQALIALLAVNAQLITHFVQPRTYVCLRTEHSVAMSGKLDDPAWAGAPWTDDFVDIEGEHKPQPRFRTRAKMLWDDKYLYIGAEMEEPHVWANLTQHDSVIFHDNDFEVFIDPDDDGRLYSEMEMNALNTTWDLLLINSYRGGGPPVTGWEIHDLKTAVNVDGTLNDPSDKDTGWSVEVAIPWTSMAEIARCPSPPNDGDQWRIDFSRVEWHTEVVDGKYVKVKGRPEDNWVWSPVGFIDMHRPERWGVLQFSTQTHGPVEAKPHPGIVAKQVLAEVWEAEQRYRREHRAWTTNLEELDLKFQDVQIFTTPNLLEIHCGGFAVDQNLRFWRLSP